MRLFTAARPQSTRYRPAMERLEDRHCPAVPVIMSMAWESGQQSFTLMGTVCDEQPAGLTVQFTGAFTGTTTTNSFGGFSLQVQPESLGFVFATVTDSEGLTSQSAQANLFSNAPMISGFSAMRVIDDMWVFSGTVSDEHRAGLKVRLGGLTCLENKTVCTDANGYFSLTLEVPQGEQGTIWAQTADWWGLSSNVATYSFHPTV